MCLRVSVDNIQSRVDIETQFIEWLAPRYSLSSIRNAQSAIRRFLTWYAEYHTQERTSALAALSVDDLKRYEATLESSARSTRQVHWWALGQLITWAGGDGKRTLLLYKLQTQGDQGRAKKTMPLSVLSDADIERLWQHLKGLTTMDDPYVRRDAVCVALLLDAGIKIGELQSLDVTHMDANTGTLTVNGRTIQLRHPCIQKLLRGWLVIRKRNPVSGNVLMPTLGEQRGAAGRRCSAPTLYLMIRRVLENAGVSSETQGGQRLRTTCMVKRIQSGEPYQAIAKHFGVAVTAVDRLARLMDKEAGKS